MALIAFLPQLVCVALLGWTFANDMMFAQFAQTFAFVLLNKVVTSQVSPPEREYSFWLTVT
jgi:hypothetical protein